MSKGRLPDFNLSALDRDTDLKQKVGAAWKNEDGSISVTLDHWVVLEGKAHGANLVLTLFPYETPEERKARFKERDRQKQENKAESRGDAPDDDIPF